MELQKQRHGVTMPNGFILPEGKTTPNTLFVGGIDMKVEEDEIREFFGRFGAVKEVKIITYRGGICKGYGFVYFSEDVDIQTIIEQQITFKGKKLKLGPAIMKERISRGFQGLLLFRFCPVTSDWSITVGQPLPLCVLSLLPPQPGAQWRYTVCAAISLCNFPRSNDASGAYELHTDSLPVPELRGLWSPDTADSPLVRLRCGSSSWTCTCGN
ncbi:deleted in azoospermia-like isoform 1-T1 [Clarias gariepinus]|uniref:deleted in azoospermia-like isoform X1 n=1 Tax=Clarias gariepinus TaxID=13013 RepID=UPI00234C691D|nr:deleted in azoospermia-like isoform X1 [Clarias gariepinus]